MELGETARKDTQMTYQPSNTRYHGMQYRRCGKSGLQLPAISLGLWHNFGFSDDFLNAQQMIFTAFDHGVTHFDLANNYGPPPGSAETNFGNIIKASFSNHLRDELIISTKAGYTMWPGPYGDWGSRKYLMSSLDKSLQRMHLDYVDIFYHHRPDPLTPIEESMMALDSIVRSGKALYVGLSNYKAPEAAIAFQILKELKTPCIIHQPKYSLFERWVETGLLDVLEENGMGCIPFSPLAQGLLTDKYLKGIPLHSRAAKENSFLKPDQITPEKLMIINKLNEIAERRGQTLAQMSLAWVLKDSKITSVLIGASKPEQITNSIDCLGNTQFSLKELQEIDNLFI